MMRRNSGDESEYVNLYNMEDDDDDEYEIPGDTGEFFSGNNNAGGGGLGAVLNKNAPFNERTSQCAVVLSVMAVFAVLGGLVAVADRMESKPLPYDDRCLNHFRVTQHMSQDSPYPAPSKQQDGERCSLLHVSVVARGGVRNPSEDAIEELDSLQNWLHASLDGRRTSLTDENLQWLVNWVNPYGEADGGKLSDRVQEELASIGKRYSGLYGSLLSNASNSTVRVRSTQDTSAVTSVDAFLRGALGTEYQQNSNLEELANGDDQVLKFAERCHAFTDLSQSMAEQKLKDLTMHLQNVARDVSAKLGADTVMDVNNVRALITGCRLEIANAGQADHFCSLIPKGDWLYLEALNDKDSAFRRANETVPFLSHPLWVDVLSSLEKCAARKISAADNDSNSPICYNFDARFGTENMLLPFLLRLGAESVTGSCTGMLSALVPSAGNVALELYDCGENSADADVADDADESDRRFRVHVRLHERYLSRIPVCSDRSYCRLSELRTAVDQQLAPEQDWESACESTSPLTRRPNH